LEVGKVFAHAEHLALSASFSEALLRSIVWLRSAGPFAGLERLAL